MFQFHHVRSEVYPAGHLGRSEQPLRYTSLFYLVNNLQAYIVVQTKALLANRGYIFWMAVNYGCLLELHCRFTFRFYRFFITLAF
jgi:hypothetical protein